MIGSGPLNSENITDLLEELDNELDRAGGRAEVYLAGGARMLFGWRADRRTSDLDGVMRTGQNLLMTTAMKMSRKHGLEPTWVNPAVAVTPGRGSGNGSLDAAYVATCAGRVPLPG